MYLKGQCLEMNIFWRSKHQYFLCMCCRFLRSFKSFSLSIINFLLASLIADWSIKCFLKPSSEFSSLWLVDVLWWRPLIGYSENAQELTRHRRLPVWFYKNHRCPPVSNFSVKFAALRSLKRVTWRIFKISKYVIYQRMYRKYLFVKLLYIVKL
jgi:hypothetical protein